MSVLCSKCEISLLVCMMLETRRELQLLQLSQSSNLNLKHYLLYVLLVTVYLGNPMLKHYYC